jgi:uncharacterized protein YejL (UPF0352 family)
MVHQIGGAKEAMIDILRKYSRPLEIYVSLAIVMGIVYIRLIPKSIAYQSSTVLGRAFAFGLVLSIGYLYSWLEGILMAVFVVLLLAVAPRIREGFQSSGSDVDIKVEDEKKKWFIEAALGENPIGIEEDKVRTQAIQDNTNSTNSVTSSTR